MGKGFTGTPVSLEELLSAREQRAEYIREYISRQPQTTVICFTLNVPGPIKTDPALSRCFEEGRVSLKKALEQEFMEIVSEEMKTCAAGEFGLYAVKADGFVVKTVTMQLEEHHPLGRIFDIDVFSQGGACISRHDLGVHHRSCLICEEDAKVCARSRRHSLEDLEQTILSQIETVCGANI